MASRRFLVVVSGGKIYVRANPLRSDRRKRTKDSIAAVRHLYLDFLPHFVPDLRYSSHADRVLSTSLGKYQILWRVNCFNFEQQESTLKLPAIPFGGDPACMDCNRVLPLPGFRNCKNDPSHPITVKYPCDSTSNPGDFRPDIPAANALPLPHAISSRKRPGKHTNSEPDWAWIRHELAHGKDAAKRTRTIASRRSDSSVASARLCSTKAFRWRTLSRCWRSAAAPRLPLRGVSERAQARMRWSHLRRRVQPGWSPRVLCGCWRYDLAFNFEVVPARCFAPEEC